MKKSVNYISALLLVLPFVMAGCLKDKGYDNYEIQAVHSNGTQKIIELKANAGSAANFTSTAYENSSQDTTVNLIPVNLASSQPATEDIQVTVALKPELVDNYNAENGTGYVIPAAGTYTIVNPVVTIPKGSNTGYLQMKLKPANFLGQTWALGFAITNVDKPGYTISANTSTAIAAFGIKNIYEGTYRSVGYFQHPTAPRPINKTKYLFTVNANTVETELGDLGSGTTIIITINPDNTVSIAPGAAANPATHLITGDPVYNNTYDPAKRVFKLKYGYPSDPTRIITETLTRQ